MPPHVVNRDFQKRKCDTRGQGPWPLAERRFNSQDDVPIPLSPGSQDPLVLRNALPAPRLLPEVVIQPGGEVRDLECSSRTLGVILTGTL